MEQRPRLGFGALLLVAPIALAGCGGDDGPVTQVVVRLGAQPCVLTEAEAIRVRVVNDEGLDVRDHLVPLVGPDAPTWPLNVPVVPKDGDADRRFWVVADLLGSADAILGSVRISSGFLEGAIAEVGGCFVEGCVGVDCGECETRLDDGGTGTCESCGGAATCGPAEATPVALGLGEDPCPDPSPSCGGDAGASTDAGGTDAGPPDAGPPPECTGDGDCDDGDGCTIDRCSDGSCEHGPQDADGDGHVSTACGGDDCNDSSSSIYGGAPEDCTNGSDDDCDGLPDCYDLDSCRFDGTCEARRCSLSDNRYRLCGGECVNVYTREDHCGSCAMRCLNDRSCTTTGLDGRPRCYCTSNADCAHGVNCNTAYNRCGCNATSCGAGARCQGDPTFPAYCVFDAD